MCNCGGPRYKPPVAAVRVQRTSRKRVGGVSEITPPTDPIALPPGITSNPADAQRTTGSTIHSSGGVPNDPLQGS